MIYLDFAASVPVSPALAKKYMQFLVEDVGNAAAQHRLGKTNAKQIESAREMFINACHSKGHGTFVFTGSATESNNFVIKGLRLGAGDRIFFSSADHPSMVAPVHQLQEKGCDCVELPLIGNGQVDCKKFSDRMTTDVKLVCLSLVNNQSGARQSIKQLAEIIRINSPEAHIHVDGAQGFSKIDFDCIDCDSFTVSGHKIGAPKGIAGVFLGPERNIEPLLVGGNHEQGYRSSTPSTALILSFLEALQERRSRASQSFKIVCSRALWIIDRLSEKVPSVKFPFFDGDRLFERSSPYILTAIIPGMPSDVVMRHLQEHNIFISTSSACSSRIKGSNPTFTALGIQTNQHKNVYRISLDTSVSQADIEKFVEIFASIIQRLKRITLRD